jgi:hypothetical protein
VLLAGLGSLAGWVLDLPRLTDWLGTGISIQPNTTVAAAAMGLALLFLAVGHPRWALAAGLLSGILGTTTLFEHVSRIDLGIDTLLMFDRPWGRASTLAPGRMGPVGAVSWTLLSLGVWLTSSGVRGRGAAAVISILVMLLSALSLVGYLFGVQQFYALPSLTAIALQTATMIFAASAGLMFAVPERGLAATSARDDAGGILLRRMVVPVFVVPLLFGWLRLEGERAGLYDTAFGDAAFVIFTTTAMLALLVLTARHIGRSAAALQDAAHTQRVLARIGELAAKVRDTGNLLEAISETAGRALDVSRCGFARVDLDAGEIVVERDYHADDQSLAGRHISIAGYGRHFEDEGRAGRPTVVRDVRRVKHFTDGSAIA